MTSHETSAVSFVPIGISLIYFSQMTVSTCLLIPRMISVFLPDGIYWSKNGRIFDIIVLKSFWASIFSLLFINWSWKLFALSNDFTRFVSSSSLMGLVRKSSAPASIDFILSSNPVSVVIIITGMNRVVSCCFISLQTLYPLSPGIIISSKTISGLSFFTFSSASFPLYAVRIS